MPNTIDSEELKTQKAILEDLRSRDIKKTGFVSAEDFQNALDGNQLTPGTELCDRIFLECTIDDNGLVFYGGFAKIVEHEMNVSKKQAMIRLIRDQVPAPTQKQETNADIIYNHTSELKALFANYEFFRINLSQLREGIKSLGIKETGKVLLLYREPSNISYTSLIRALMVEEDEEMYNKPAGKTTAQMTNDLSHYDNITSNNCEVNEHENPLNWGDDIPPLPEQGKYIKLKEKPPIPELMISNLNEIQNKSQMLIDGEEIEDLDNYDNEDGEDGFEEPTYDECLKILRQKIYDQIRMLTSGYINVKQFRDELEQMNVPIPESAEHHLNQFELTGDIPFHSFVSAFDKYFDTLVEVPPSPPPPPEEEDERFIELGKAIEERLKEPSPAKTATHHHGDIIAWQHDGELTDNIENIQTKNRSVLDESDPTALYWNDDTIRQNKENVAPAPIVVKKTCWAAGDSGDFITWTDVPEEATCEGPKFNKVTLLHYDSPEPPFATHENVTPDFEPGKTKTWKSSITIKKKEKTGDWLFTPPPPPPQPYQMDYPFGTNLPI